FEIGENELSGYRGAADFLNISDVDIVCLQHEYGIYGGRVGSHILSLMRELRMPIVTTLHTILREPSELQKQVMDEVVQLSERIVVMSEKGAGFMQEVHGVSADKIDLIHHGIPDVRFESTTRYKERLGVAGDSVLLTFGLLGPDKGIEYVIQALPKILERHPNVVYTVVGATHPNIRAQVGETYRLSLERLAHAKGVEGNVVFHNRFVGDDELSEFLGAADIYITPYLKPEQITSGTLAYAVGSGKAVISTPYWYAEELLADGRGVLVPWRDSDALADAVIRLLGNDKERKAIRTRAADFGRQMVWPSVARQYLASFERAASDAAKRRGKFHTKMLAGRPAELPDVTLNHIRLMTDSTGIFQHATFAVPNYDEGYCVDDNARALMLMAYLEEDGYESSDLKGLMARYLAFLNHALNKTNGRFMNFLSYDRRWLEEAGSEDSHGRSLYALGTVVGRSYDPSAQGLAKRLFDEALPVVSGFSSPRAWAFSLLGIDEYMRAYMGESRVQEVRLELAEKLFSLYCGYATDEWPWFEDRVTYSNSRLSQALLVSGQWMSRADMVTAGLASLDWLTAIQQTEEGYFSPVGSNGFYVRGKQMAEFDQQPVEAMGVVSACLDALRVTGDPKWTKEARRAFNWFLGQNRLQASLYDPTTGGCRDGLHDGRLNENQGAESSLAFLVSLLELRLAENDSSSKAPLSVYTS
ncbi:MAG: glycosyltransferase, partial [Armatimonadetes bacterium]|nr:glycosyltransferase [Armatimonadota bacterium]